MPTVLRDELAQGAREPRFEAALEGDGGDDGDEDRRQHGDEAEQADDADVEAGRGGARPTLAHQAVRLPGDDDDEQRARARR